MKILACGSNGNYQLGLGHANDSREFECVSSISSYYQQSKHIIPHPPSTSPLPNTLIEMSLGGNHSVILMPDGRVYIAGIIDNRKYHTFTHMDCFKDHSIKHVVSGWDYVIFHEPGGGGGGKLWILGSLKQTHDFNRNDDTMEFNGHVLTGISSIFNDGDDQIVKLKSSPRHVLCQMKSGKLLGMGDNKHGQIIAGYPSKQIIHLPLDIPPFPNHTGNDVIIDYSLSIKSTCFIVSQSQVPMIFVTSRTGYRQISMISPLSNDLQLLRVISTWQTFYIYSSSILAQLKDDLLILEDYPKPGRIVDIKAGSHHLLLLLSSSSSSSSSVNKLQQDAEYHRLYGKGWNEHGNLSGNQEMVADWTEIPVSGLKNFWCGCATSFLLL